MRKLNTALISSQQPALEQGGDPVDLGQQACPDGSLFSDDVVPQRSILPVVVGGVKCIPLFLKLVVAGHSTIYVTRAEKHFWQKPYPSPFLFSATSLTEIIGTLFAVYGVFLTPIGWKNALLVWVYALAWFLVNDFVKIWVLGLLRKERGIG
jgi:hypothetical protein